jgi:hypothetical protein
LLQSFDFELQEWFDFKIPKTKIPEDFIFWCVTRRGQL